MLCFWSIMGSTLSPFFFVVFSASSFNAPDNWTASKGILAHEPKAIQIINKYFMIIFFSAYSKNPFSATRLFIYSYKSSKKRIALSRVKTPFFIGVLTVTVWLHIKILPNTKVANSNNSPIEKSNKKVKSAWSDGVNQ